MDIFLITCGVLCLHKSMYNMIKNCINYNDNLASYYHIVATMLDIEISEITFVNNEIFA